MNFDSYYSSVLTEMTQGIVPQDDREWLYCGVFLNNESKRQLKDEIVRLFHNEIPSDWTWYCDHVTMAFNSKNNPDAQAFGEQVIANDLGKQIRLTVTGVGVKNNVIAAEVTGVQSANKHIHITCAVAPGTKPVESNYITNWIHLKNESNRIHLYGTVNVVRPNKKI